MSNNEVNSYKNVYYDPEYLSYDPGDLGLDVDQPEGLDVDTEIELPEGFKNTSKESVDSILVTINNISVKVTNLLGNEFLYSILAFSEEKQLSIYGMFVFDEVLTSVHIGTTCPDSFREFKIHSTWNSKGFAEIRNC